MYPLQVFKLWIETFDIFSPLPGSSCPLPGIKASSGSKICIAEHLYTFRNSTWLTADIKPANYFRAIGRSLEVVWSRASVCLIYRVFFLTGTCSKSCCLKICWVDSQWNFEGFLFFTSLIGPLRAEKNEAIEWWWRCWLIIMLASTLPKKGSHR